MARTDHLLVEKEGHVVIVTMNRPEARNAFSPEMLVRMADAWDLIDGDPTVRVAILTGANNTFSSGSDLKLMAGGWGDNEWSARFKKEPDLHWKSLLRHYRLKKPLVAAVEGVAVAGGTEILQATDIRVAGASARFGVSEARWSLYPMGGSAVRLRRQIPYAAAAEILLTGRHLLAQEAKDLGLINYVVPDGTALDKAMEISGQIAANGPLAVEAILKTLRVTETMSEAEAFDWENAHGMAVMTSADSKEGPRAFAEKRTPNFQRR